MFSSRPRRLARLGAAALARFVREEAGSSTLEYACLTTSGAAAAAAIGHLWGSRAHALLQKVAEGLSVGQF